MSYIKRIDAKEKVYKALRTPAPNYRTDPFHDSMSEAVALVQDIPDADVAPVKHGWWIKVELDKDDDGVPALVMAGCTQCNMVSWTPTPFCGYCGAKMEPREAETCGGRRGS